MAELLSYQGNAGLGLGSNPDVPAVVKMDFDVLNNAARDIMLQDNQWNIMRYQQKIKDQALLRDAIDSGQVSMGYILPEYQPKFDAAKNKMEKFFQTNGDKFISDPQKYREYETLKRDLKDIALYAQVNTKGIQELQAEKAKQTLPGKQEKIQKHIDEQLAATSKSVFNPVKPYQQLHDFSIADITEIPPSAVIKSSYSSPTDPFDSYDSTVVDYDQILKHKYNQYINDKTGEAADSIDQFYDKMQQRTPEVLNADLNAMDAQIARYNKARGFTKGTPGFVEPVKREAVAGQLIIKEPKADFAAKWALTNQGQFVTKTPKFNKELGSYQVAKERAETDAVYKRIMAGTAQRKAQAYIENTRSQIAARKKPEEQDAYMEEMYNRNLLNQPSLLMGDPKRPGQIGFKNIPAESSLPVFTINGSSAVQLQPIDGKLVGKTWHGGHYEPVYKLGGKNLSLDQLNSAYKGFKKKVGSQWTGSMDDYLKKQIELGNIDFLIKGANGTIDRKVSMAAQRAMSNKNTTKGEEGIFEPQDTQIPDQNQEE